MAETIEMTETRQYKLREVRIRLEEGRSLISDQPMSNPEAAMEVMRRELSGYDREVLCVVNLNNRMKPINFHVVSVGDLTQSIASIPNILKSGILSNAHAFLLLHNHPSGDVTPSGLDIQTTRRVVEAGKILGISCMDHIIVGGGNGMYFSMREQGIVDFADETISMAAEEILRVGEETDRTTGGNEHMAERDQREQMEQAAGGETMQSDQSIPGEGTRTVTGEKARPEGERPAYPSRREQLKEITDRLEAGVKEYMTSDVQFKKVLEAMSKFHRYSANNVLLIAMQMPEATRVASYTTWKTKFKRQVMRGQKGLSIIAPAPVKERREREVVDSRTGSPVLGADGKPKTEEVEVTIPRFKVEKVFDLSQTVGEPLPELDVPELTGDAEHFQMFIDALTAISPVPIRFADIESGAKGYYHTVDKEIVIQKGMSESQTLKTLVHEVSHARLHDRDTMKAEGVAKSAQQKELEAESIAYTVMFHYHMDTSGYSIPYLASWSGSQDTKQLKACMDTIRRTAGEIIEEMDTFMAERMKERAAEHSAEQDADRFTIYQIRPDSPAGAYEFMGMDFVKQKGYEIRQEDFQAVYTGSLVPGTALEDLFVQFNGPKMPEDFTGHSLSVSDIVVIHRDGKDHAFYVDRFGYEEVPEFLSPVQEHEKAVQAEAAKEAVLPERSDGVLQSSDRPEKQPKLTFFVAQCMEFPVMGEYHGDLSLIEALKIYQEMPDGQMGKGIGFTLRDGSEFAGDFALVAGGRVQDDVINGVEHYRLDPDIQAAIAEARIYVHPATGEHEHGKDDQKDLASGKKESVLAKLSEKQKTVKASDKTKPEKMQKSRTSKRGKGEQAI
ncbi:MAG: ImmA/IrrE family metallo-endopeptidase [Blautia sp.]|nr:ImmA/IrrE family metallo-endopeptidase [Blautia sp.]